VPNLVKTFLSKKELHEIAGAIAAAEKRTSGEIRVSIRQKRSKKERSLSVEQLARHEFVHLGMMKTEQRTGILIFILLDAREFFILADEHINEKVEPDTWKKTAEAMSSSFARKEFLQGLLTAVASVGEHLARHFPPGANQKNELPDKVELS
jgi:uncharacterized membrane protein